MTTTTTTIATYSGVEPGAAQHLDDAGVRFYQLWLDPTLTYSCAAWADGEEDRDLEAAQTRKLDDHLREAGAVRDGRLLDIGCGWGSLLQRAVRRHGVSHAVGLTLNADQASWVNALQDPRIEARTENWFDHTPAAPYDSIVCVAAFEAFARPGMTLEERQRAYRGFFERCHGWLRPGGSFSLQTLGLDDPPPPYTADNQRAHPYSLPTPATLARSVSRLFKITHFADCSADSVRTLRAWLSRLSAVRDAAVAEAGETTVKKYEDVLKTALLTFRLGKLRLFRATLSRADRVVRA